MIEMATIKKDEIVGYQLGDGKLVHIECATDGSTAVVTYGEMNRALKNGIHNIDERFYIRSRCGYALFDEPPTVRLVKG
jgi:hypothetical protein